MRLRLSGKGFRRQLRLANLLGACACSRGDKALRFHVVAAVFGVHAPDDVLRSDLIARFASKVRSICDDLLPRHQVLTLVMPPSTKRVNGDLI